MTVTHQLRILTLCLSLWLASCTECGKNPMNPIHNVAYKSGKTPEYVLSVLQQKDPLAYRQQMHKNRSYIACMGFVDTSYIGKRTRSSMRQDGDDAIYFRHLSNGLDQAIRDPEGSQYKVRRKREIPLPERYHLQK